MKDEKVRAVIYIPPKTHAELEQKAFARGITVATVILEILADSKK
jgi:hypothetical protein